ncbi:MAG: TolC family protein [Deltaproteobacteria bacterium]|nr:MAG: TolC family protein [Deltaproteobacteria bacterium]
MGPGARGADRRDHAGQPRPRPRAPAGDHDRRRGRQGPAQRDPGRAPDHRDPRGGRAQRRARRAQRLDRRAPRHRHADRRRRARPAGRHRPRYQGPAVRSRPAGRARLRRQPRARPARQAGSERDARHRGHRERGTFADATSNLVKLNSISINGSLTFSQSLGRHEVLGRVREQRELRRKLAVNGIDLRAQVAQTMARAVAQIELARRRVTLSQRAIDLANENIKIETDRFNLGKATNFDVLNRLEELRQAELRKTQAMIDWHKAEVVVQALTGDLLPMYGVAVD